MRKPQPIDTVSKFVVAAVCAIILFAFLQMVTGCVSFPLPPAGDEAGKWGYVDVRVSYRPNFETIVSAMRRPNPDLATLKDK
jgi:hypothetical protein